MLLFGDDINRDSEDDGEAVGDFVRFGGNFLEPPLVGAVMFLEITGDRDLEGCFAFTNLDGDMDLLLLFVSFSGVADGLLLLVSFSGSVDGLFWC